MINGIDVPEVLKIGSGVFALILFSISLMAYYRVRERRLLFVSSAFGLYFVKVIAAHLDIFIANLETSFLDFLVAFIDFVILLFFFLAIVKK